MKDEEFIFDFMAAAEDTGKRLDALIKAIPGELRNTLAAEYQRSPWLATLPTEVERLSVVVKSSEAAAGRTELAATQIVGKIKSVCRVACLAAIVMPLVTWGLVYWQTGKLRDEQAAIKAETDRLHGLAAALKDETGGGVVIWNLGNGKYGVALPTGAESDWNGRYKDGRYGFTYTLPLVSK
jgi:hypothetical protein